MSLRIAVLASGRGSNLDALRQACADGRVDGSVVGLFSDRPDSGAVTLARGAGIQAWAVEPNGVATREAFDAALFDAIAAVQPDLIVCAGYMRIISAGAIARFPNRMLNIHPSLLPKYPGLRTHQRALDAGDAEHGASVHVVIPELDAGPVLAQARVPVHPGDDASSLAARVLAREHPLLVATVAAVAAGELGLPRDACDAEAIRWRGAPLLGPLRLAADNTLGTDP